MNPRYEHTQIGHVILIVMGGVAIVLGGLMASNGFHWAPALVMAVVLISGAFFATLTVTVDDAFVSLKFGPGVIRKSFPINEIESCSAVRNHWLYGWGIHLTPHGWIFNVSGLGAVQIRMKSGRSYRIGTDEPDALARAIQEAIPRP